jgi:hypothetical protein
MNPIERARLARKEAQEAMAEAQHAVARAEYYEQQAWLWQKDPVAYRKQQEVQATKFNSIFKNVTFKKAE